MIRFKRENFSHFVQSSKRYSRVAILLAAILGFTPLSSFSQNLSILQYGVWGLSANPDPFKNKYPVVSYLPPGTIIFSVEPSLWKDYVRVLTQYGHKLHIKNKISVPGAAKKISVLTPIAGLLSSPPTNSLVFHKSILCLAQSNRIVPPPGRCIQFGEDIRTTLPVGKGWIYTFHPSAKGERWLNLDVILDSGTKAALTERGLNPNEANFEITYNELSTLEKQGLITLLDKKMPPVTFEYPMKAPVFIRCGQKKVTEKSLKASIGATVSAGAGADLPLWTKLISGLTAKLGLSADLEAGAASGTKWTINIDTTRSSYLYYTVNMIDNETNRISNILIEKTFECRESPNIQPGERILRVVFEIEQPGSPDVDEYAFEKSGDYIKVPESLLGHHPRPVFISVNSPDQHADVLRKIAEKQNVDIPLAHFMLSHLNNTCKGTKRTKCEELILTGD